ncbi:MAG: RsmD family RNA methyltransferase, partial [Burkholderiaceae bacterium]
MGQVRIIGGLWKRSVLRVVDRPGLRPTPDRVRETLFNWIESWAQTPLIQSRVCDVFAGTGALAFEAAS